MYRMIGRKKDGSLYDMAFSSNLNFNLRMEEVKADPDRHFPHVITGTRAKDKLPAFLQAYLTEYKAEYLQTQPDAQKQKGRCYNLVIRTDPVMPVEMGGMISSRNDKTIITVNGNYGRIAQLAEFLHEATHLWRDDLNSPKDADTYKIEEDCKADLIAACKVILADAEKEGNM